MTKDQIIAMAMEADQGHAGMECLQFGGGFASVSTLERFASLVAAQAAAEEREQCAKVCEAESLGEPQDDSDAAYDLAVKHCAAAIRERTSP